MTITADVIAALKLAERRLYINNCEGEEDENIAIIEQALAQIEAPTTPCGITADDLVRREVHYCVSSLVSTLAQGCGATINTGFAPSSRDLSDLFEQAAELSAPIDDWEEAAREAGFERSDAGHLIRYPTDREAETADDWREACDIAEVEPYQREVFEHWIVSDWLADKLEAKGEKVDHDFAGMTVWARTTTGQGIASDSVIEAIVEEINRG